MKLVQGVRRIAKKMKNLPENSTKLRLLMSGYLPPPFSGIGTYYQNVLHSSLAERVDLRFVITSAQTRKSSSTGRFSTSNLVSAFSDIWRFTRAVANHRPQICHIATAFGLSFVKHSVCVMVARLLGSRVISHPHCSLSALYTGRSRRWQWYFRQMIHLTQGVVALSREWLQLDAIVPGCKVYFLPNAIDLKPYQEIAQERFARQDDQDGKLKALYLGHLGAAKGSGDLIEAAKRLVSEGMEVSFCLIGEELTPGELESLKEQTHVAGLNGSLSLLPPVYGSEKLDYFRNVDIFVYPSYSEGMPMAVLEAMACGLPVVATRVGGLPDQVVDGVNGILVEPGQQDQLASAIRKLVTDKALRHSMEQKSYQLASEKFDIEQHVNQLIKIYESVLSA